jgi:hypothetical protein
MTTANSENIENTDLKNVNEAKTPKQENSKTDRLDRLEEKLELIENGILLLVNMTGWMNATVTPIGTHNPEIDYMGYESLEDAINEGSEADEESGN